MSTTAGTTYRFAVVDMPLRSAVDALASVAVRRAGRRSPSGIEWPRRPLLVRDLPLGPATGWVLKPSLSLRHTFLSTASVTVELLPWDDRRTELGLRLEGNMLLRDDRYGALAERALAAIAADLVGPRALEPA